LNNIQIDETGIVSARFTNGQFNVLGKMALGIFPNPNGLQQLGDNAWAESVEAGTLRLGEAGSGSLGFVQSSSLEASNVDISKELVNLITAQRNFQANAQVITTADTVTQTIINIR
jgi:flagellar hook protein FlgE